jgi:hypothetical protein
MYQELKRNMISYDEETKQREEQIAQQKIDLANTQRKLEELNLEYGSLNIQYEKETEQLEYT